MTPEPPPSFTRGRRWPIALNTALLLLAVVALLAMVNYLAARHHRRFDWSGSTQTELSPRTRQVLAAVTNEVRVVLYFERSSPLFKMSQSLLAAYAAANPRIVIETIDYKRDTAAALAAKARYKLTEKTDRDMVIFDCQGRTKPVHQGDLSDLDLNELLAGRSGEVKRITFKGEMLFTSAILTVITPRPLKAYFLQGHGEHPPDKDEGLNGYSRFASGLGLEGVKFEKLQIEGPGGVPPDCNLLIIAGPRQQFSDEVLEKIDNYLRQGGRSMVLFNMETANRATGLEELLKGWGVLVGRNVVTDERHASSQSKLDMVISSFSGHRIVKPILLSGLHLILPRTIARDSGLGRGGNVPQVEEFAFTSPGGRVSSTFRSGVAVRSPDDKIGAIPLMVAVERGGVRNISADRGATRIVVTGDSYFLANDNIDRQANAEFASHAVNWLLNREDLLVPIPPRPIKEYKINLSAAQMTQVQWIFLVAMPGAALLLGGLVWLRRRR